MTLKELEEKLNKMTLEEFGVWVNKNYRKLLREPKKLGAILKIYGARVMAEKKFKKVTRDKAIEELLDLNLFSEGGDDK